MVEVISGVYGIFDTESGECLYVGQSRNIHERWKGHLKGLALGTHKRKDFVLWFWQHSSNESALSFRVLEYCRPHDDSLNTVEIRWFNKLSPRFYGKRPSLKERWEHSDETKLNIVRGMMKSDRYKSIEPILPRECSNCGKTFAPQSKRNQVYCSKPCVLNNKAIRTRGFIPRVDLNVDEICKMYSDGLSLRKLAKEFNVSHITIRSVLLENGVPLKTQGVSY